MQRIHLIAYYPIPVTGLAQCTLIRGLLISERSGWFLKELTKTYDDVVTVVAKVVELPELDEEMISEAETESSVEEVATTTASAEDKEASGGNDPGLCL